MHMHDLVEMEWHGMNNLISFSNFTVQSANVFSIQTPQRGISTDSLIREILNVASILDDVSLRVTASVRYSVRRQNDIPPRRLPEDC